MTDTTITIDILGHADFAAELRAKENVPGILKFYSAVQSIREKNPKRTLLLDAGDNFCDTLWDGKTIVEALTLLETDVMTLGNHEFDYGKDFLEATLAACPFPVLCANISEKETGNLVKGTLPYTLVDLDGMKLGIVGVTTEYTPYMVEKKAFLPYQIGSSAEACHKYIPELRSKGAEIIVVLAHHPFYINPEGVSGELIDLLHAVKDLQVDVMIGGHIPGDFASEVEGVSVLKGGFGGKSLPHLSLSFDTNTRKVTGKAFEMIDVMASAYDAHKPALNQFIETISREVEPYLTEVLGTLEEDLLMRLAFESPMGNFFADCARAAGKTELAYMNATSSGRILTAGDLNREKIITAMGFNDPIMVAGISGAQLYELFEMVYEPERFGNNAGLIHSGFVVEVDHHQAAGKKVQGIWLENGDPVLADQRYSICTSQYMASGGNGTAALAEQLQFEDTGIRMHDAIFDYVRTHKLIQRPAMGRLIFHGTPENDNSPF